MYEELLRQNVEVIYDDRTVSTGVMFSDADLLGVPARVVARPGNMKESCFEIETRDKRVLLEVPVDNAVSAIKDLINKLIAEY